MNFTTHKSTSATATREASSRRRGVLARLAARIAAITGSALLAIGAQSTPPQNDFYGPEGGPFPTAPVVVALQNTGPSLIRWRTIQSPTWLTFSKNQGKLTPGAAYQLSATVNQTAAASLPAGIYNASVAFLDPQTGQRRDLARYRLTVQQGSYAISVTPAAPLDIAGPVGGPFSPNATSYTITNTGNVAFDWSVTSDSAWLAVGSPSSGTLVPGGAVLVPVSIANSTANALAAGHYTATLSFRRAATNVEFVARAVNLDVLAASGGWTQFTPSVDTRVVYVSSSSGNDSNSGLSANAPKRTIAAGKALMRNGYPDWLLLKKGETWTESIGHWICSGRSTSERMLISSYGAGTQRPTLLTGSSDGMIAIHSGSSPPQINHVALVGIKLQAHTYAGTGSPSGVVWLIDSQDLLVEDCFIQGYEVNLCIPSFGGVKRDVAFRRNIIVDAFATQGTVGHGIYTSSCQNLLIEENVIDRNGWNPAVAGATPSMFRHGMYIQSGASGGCSGVVVRGNIVSNSASHGLHLRPGGLAEDNLFVRNAIALSVGGGDTPQPGGIDFVARGNVILDGKDIDAANPRGWGIDMYNVASGLVAYNIVANQTLGHFPVPIDITGQSGGIGVHNVTIERNIVSGWGGSVVLSGTSTEITQVRLRYNDFNWDVGNDQIIDHFSSSSTAGVSSNDNRFFALTSPGAWMRVGSSSTSLSGWANLVGDVSSTTLPSGAYPAPQRTLASYHQSIGGTASHDAFMAQARTQSKDNWRPEYAAAAVNAYIRAGFGMQIP